MRSCSVVFFVLVRHHFAETIWSVAQHGARYSGIILTRIGFAAFFTSDSSKIIPSGSGGAADGESIAFVPMAMPIMFGPGGIATLIGMAATTHLAPGGMELENYAASFLAMVATMAVTCLLLIYAAPILTKIGPKESMLPRESPVFLFPRWEWDCSSTA